MDNKSFEIQVLERLTAIETTLKQQDYKAISERLNHTENRSIGNEKRIDRIEDNMIIKKQGPRSPCFNMIIFF